MTRDHRGVRYSPYERGHEVPTPELVAAWLALGCLAPERVPVWAAFWLADGKDGEALRELAGTSGRDPREVRDVLPAALREAGVDVPSPDDLDNVSRHRIRAWAAVVYRDLARLCLNGRASPRWVVRKVMEIVGDNGYDDAVTASPVGGLFALDDEWGAGWGRTAAELEEVVRAACREELTAASG